MMSRAPPPLSAVEINWKSFSYKDSVSHGPLESPLRVSEEKARSVPTHSALPALSCPICHEAQQWEGWAQPEEELYSASEAPG